ncbi:PQQ-dependent sugar dehydrogenase [Marinobacter sp.]|uniref:PQQ-dependent sugar dehydrogenase n=1 Tax=Marinobacter sp. TaxID=50741 RepID=UPI003A8D0866
MKGRQGIGRILLGFLAALMAGVILGSVVQTQLNMLALQELGIPIDMATRLFATAHDLLNFGPVYAILFGAAFLPSQAVAAGVLRVTGPHVRGLVFALAAAAGLWAALAAADALAPMPTLIAATRSQAGLAAMLGTAALAGWLFARLSASRLRSEGSHSATSMALCCLVVGVAWPYGSAKAQSEMNYSVETVASGLERPWSLAFLPAGGALVTERPGRLRRISDAGRLLEAPITGVPAVFNDGQAGLFEVVLSPEFSENRMIFLSYACGTRSANHLCVAKGRLEGEALEGVTEIFRATPAKYGNAHYGGRMAWLPDSTLVVTLGDGFDFRERAQDLSSHLGKIVRLNPDGIVPGDNPFFGREGVLPEIYSYGHRNVQGLLYDPVEDRLIAHEHGPRGGDEINLIKPGNNYGWPVITHGIDYTGALVSPFTEREGMEQPLLYWSPSIAPSGMTRYWGDLFPAWRGSLLVGALADRSVHRVELDGLRAKDSETLFKELNERIRDVVSGPEGAVYLLTDSPEGRVLRILPQS